MHSPHTKTEALPLAGDAPLSPWGRVRHRPSSAPPVLIAVAWSIVFLANWTDNSLAAQPVADIPRQPELHASKPGIEEPRSSGPQLRNSETHSDEPPADEPAGEPPGEEPPAEEPFEDPFGEDDPFADDPFGDDPFGIETTNWDSVFASVDDEFAAARGGPLTPLLSGGYNKAQGLHLGGGVALGPIWNNRFRVEGLYGYDFSRKASTGHGKVRYGDLIKERAWVEFELYDDVRPFGSHQPYGNQWLTFLAGYDGVSYLREQRGRLRGQWKPRNDWTLALHATRAEHRPLPPKEDFHLFGSDRWMEFNHQADPTRVNGIGLEVHHRPRYSEDVVLPGLYLSTSGTMFGGSLGGDREFSVWNAKARIVQPVREKDELHLRADWKIVGGRAPVQALADIGSAGGLRGFEPRSFVGRQRWFTRAEYKWNRPLIRAKLPLIGKPKLLLVPFAEAGAIWGERDILHPFDLKLSERRDIHWDLGFGLRREVDSSGLLSYVQINFAWPMGADTGPPRITVGLSSKGFEDE